MLRIEGGYEPSSSWLDALLANEGGRVGPVVPQNGA
jgi:hypothetical protein